MTKSLFFYISTTDTNTLLAWLSEVVKKHNDSIYTLNNNKDNNNRLTI